jgi:hypothetical protein
MQHPQRRWEGCRGDPWGSGFPDPARARAQEPAVKTGHGEQTLQPLRGAPRVTWRQLDGLTSNPLRPLSGRWRQRLKPGGRVAQASGRPARPRRVPPRPMRAGQGGVDRRPHARTGCTSALREGLRDARPRGTAWSEESGAGKASDRAQGHRWRTIAGEGGVLPVSRKR